jgi:hypothetical protein
MNIEKIIKPFQILRERGIQTPCYARLLACEDDPSRRTAAWIWRETELDGKEISTGETLVVTIESAGPIRVTWIPMFQTKIEGDPCDLHYLDWFFDQDPRVAGGTYQSIDDFIAGPADWSLATSDFYLVRCGWHNGRWRQPSQDAIDWVSDPERCLTSEHIRERHLYKMLNPRANGERLTIRRIFRTARVQV